MLKIESGNEVVTDGHSTQRTCTGFVLQMAHFYSKKSIVKKSLQNITKRYLRVSSLMSTIYFLHYFAFLWYILGLNACPIDHT